MQKINPEVIKNLLRNEPSEKLNKVVDKVLNQILGQEATEIIYCYLENKHFIQRHEIARELDAFLCAMREYLGTGALVIEEVIFKILELQGLEENKGICFAERPKNYETDVKLCH